MGRQIFNIKGMLRDIDPEKASNQYAYEIRNMRLTVQNDSTLFALTTEKGNKQYILSDNILGNIIGYCVLNNYIILFTHSIISDCIYRLNEDSSATVPTMNVVQLFSGNLGFTDNTEIESLGIYENEAIQKVYWIDGNHQPRFINIMKTDYSSDETFDFIKSLSLNEYLDITKNYGTGLFNAGVIEYAICYYNKNGQSSNITSVSPIYYISDKNSGNNQESSVLNNFTIKIINPDENFDYLRVYSIQRTSLNGTPRCVKVADINIANNIKILGNHIYLSSFYPNNTNPEYQDIGSISYTGDISDIKVFNSLYSEALPISNFLYRYNNTSVIYRIPKNYIIGIETGTSGYSSVTNDIEIYHDINTGAISIGIVPVVGITGTIREYTAIYFSLGNEIKYIETTDYGFSNEVVNYSELLYIGGSVFKPKSMELKNGTLFFGNYSYESPQITSSFIDTIRNNATITFGYSEIPVNKGLIDKWYQYNNQLDLNNDIITTFKGGETYTFGIILQDKYGIWSSVIPIGSAVNTHYPFEKDDYFRPVKAGITLSDEAYNMLIQEGIKRVKTVVMNNINYKSVFCQGVLCPTVFSKERKTTNLYSQSSWYTRSIPCYNHAADSDRVAQRVHNRNIASIYNSSINTVSEVYGASDSYINDYDTDAGNNAADFFVDWNTLTLHSPDISFNNYYYEGLNKMRLVGRLPIRSVRTNMVVNTKTPGKFEHAEFEYFSHQAQDTAEANYSDLSLFSYFDYSLNQNGGWNMGQKSLYPILTWHRTGSLTMQPTPNSGDNWVAELDTKVMSSIKVCPKTIFSEQLSFDTSEMMYYQDDSNALYIEADENNLDYPDLKLYKGEIDTIVTSAEGMKAVSKKIDGTLQNAYLYYNNQGVRMRYKSTPHGVFSLKYTTDNLQTILPNVPYNSSTQIPFWSHQTSTVPYYEYTIKDIVSISISTVFDTSDIIWNNTGHSIWIKASAVNTIFNEIPDLNDCILFNVVNIIPASISSEIENYIWILKDKAYRPQSATEDYYSFHKFSYNDINDPTWWTDKPDGDYEFFFAYITDSYVQRYSMKINKSSAGSLVPVYATQEYTEAEITPLNVESGVYQPSYPSDNEYDYLYLAEFYKTAPTVNLFLDHNWNISGQSVDITEHNRMIPITYGDTYYQRYDCLKTYPYSLEDQNQVVEIFSFMCETKINIDGRYDLRRGQWDNTSVLNTNFNLFNTVYSQEDNFFNYHYLEPETYSLNNFPNQIIWSGNKIYGSIIDEWTKIIPTSVLDMDGSFGEIQALKLWNDNLICFQDKSISKIMYNERTTLSTQQGVPIEIANSGKVDGKVYLSTIIGCNNKNSIKTTSDGIYFIDSNTKEIYRWSNNIEPISKNKGFNTYLFNNTYIDSEKTFYDPKLKDVYFMFGNECLIYNEILQEFTEFTDYSMSFLFPFKTSLIAIKNNNLWLQFGGDYLSFFNEDIGYSIDIISAEQPTEDKIFSIIEFRAEVLNDNIMEPYSQDIVLEENTLPFTKIRVWNEYQDTGTVDFERTIKHESGANLIQKYRIWRGDIPRVYDKPLERIRNQWARFKLSDDGDNKKTVVHDIVINYV